MSTRSRRVLRVAAGVITGVVTMSVLTPTALADPNNNTAEKLTKAVTLGGVTDHLDAFQKIADRYGDRAAGRLGYAASVDYVNRKLVRAGYDTTVQEFDFPYFEENSELAEVSPTPTSYVDEVDFLRNGFTPTFEGEATGVATPVDVVLPPGPEANSNSSGCEAADFATFPAGNIALMQRGTCGFNIKVQNAMAAGAAGVVLFNEGQPDRTGLLIPIGEVPGLNIPVVFATFETGNALATGGPRTVKVKVDFTEEVRKAYNVFAETDRGDVNNVVMAGSHLDSVQDGAGINDNGSGSAALLETAIQMAKVKPKNKVRFAWWGAEESGLLGSEHYVATLPQAEQDKITLYLNFDMVGSPNYFFGVYDGDNSSGTAPEGFIPPGSAEIEDVFTDFYGDRGQPSEDTEFSGRSDYGPFIAVGIPAGGLFTGAEGVKTAEQATLYGGVAGAAYDPCYHQPCDSNTPVADGADRDLYKQLNEKYKLRGNINTKALDVNADAIATAVITFAYDTSSLPPRAPASTARTASAAGGHGHDLARAGS